MILAMIVTILEHLGMALLGRFFKTTATAAQSAGIDSNALQYLYDLVDSAEKNTSLADGDAKYDFVFSEAVRYFSQHGMDIAIALVENLIQLAVHHHHTSNGVAGQTVASVITQMQSAPPASSAKP